MKTKKILSMIFSFLLLILLINLVSAQEDFTALTKGSIELCPCSNQAYKVIVENTGAVDSTYTLLASSDAAKWVTFNPKKFVLTPGQKGSFFVFVNSDCNIEGDYDLEVFITTNTGLTKVIEQTLKFSKCYDYSLEQGEVIEEVKESVSFLQHDDYYSLCKNEQKIIPILITNNENFENRYRLFLDAPEWASLNVNKVRLDAKKSGIFLINLDTPDVDGEFDFKLNVISELGKVQRKKNIEINVGECYALELDLEKENDIICGGEDKSYEVIIKNSGTLRQNIDLEVDGPDWVGFEQKVTQKKVKEDTLNASENESKDFEIETASISSTKKVLQLNPDEEKVVRLNVNPPEDVSENFKITVHATPDNKTEFRVSDTINVNVIEKLVCYQADISTKTSVTNFYNKDLFFAKVRNDGIKKAVYDVSLEGVSWVSASPGTLELNPGQSGNINLNVNPSTNIDPGTYGVKIILESNDAVYSKNVDIILKEENESVKKLKTTLKLYQYYIYLAILIIILIIVFRKQIYEIRDGTKKRYEKYKVKRARLEALKLAREKRKEEREKKEEVRVEKKKESKARKKEFKISFKKPKLGIYLVVIVLIVALGIFLGHYFKLFNAKYLHIYIRNFFVGYLYYILIGVGIVVVLFLLLLLYTYLSKRKRRGKVKKEAKKAERKARKKINWSKIFFSVIVSLILIGLISAIAYFDIFESIKDFFVLYTFYFVLGIVILIIIILLMGFYKPLLKFFRE